MQISYDLTQFKIDIAKISHHLLLSSTGSLCIMGTSANVLLTRLCVRALLPASHGGLGATSVIVVDAGNESDYYLTVNFVRQYGLDLKPALDKIIVSRTFTVHQLKSLLRELPKVMAQYQAAAVFVPGLLNLFDDPNVKKREAKRLIERIMQSISALSSRLLVIASVHANAYANMVLSRFDKRIILSGIDRGRLSVDIYAPGRSNVTLSEHDLSIVRQ